MITLSVKGSFAKTTKYLEKLSRAEFFKNVEKIAQQGVAALAAATPAETGLTASSWDVKVQTDGKGCTITWTNSNVVNGAPIAIMLQYGHGTGTGGYVQGRDYINPAMKPIFDKIAEDVRKAVANK